MMGTVKSVTSVDKDADMTSLLDCVQTILFGKYQYVRL